MYHLKDLGSFYIGGRDIQVTNQPLKQVRRNKDLVMKVNPNGHYAIESVYVQYFLPENSTENYILIHGGGHTAAVWETTPDGRKGWLHLLLENNIGVYLIDSVERGRSGWCPIPGVWEGEPEMRTKQTTWLDFRLGSQYGVYYENLQFPINSISQLFKYNVPRWNCNAGSSIKAVCELIEKIGCCNLIAHSQGCDIAMQCLNFKPELIKDIILLEPAAFPQLTPSVSSAAKIRMVFGDYIEGNLLWTGIKKLATDYQRALKQQAIYSEIISLPANGIYGNSHMLMMEKNNQQIFDLLFKSS